MSRHKSHLDNETEFVLTVLIAGTVYAHRVFLKQGFDYLVVFAIVIFSLLFLFILRRRLTRHNKHNQINTADIDHMTGIEFEKYVAKLLESQGYGAIRFTEKYDYGIDIIAIKNGVTWGVQVKRYSGLVKADAVRQVVTALNTYHCDRSMVITNSNYSKVAKDLARQNECVLINRKVILAWMDSGRYQA